MTYTHFADLHVHSNCSDGTLTPEELVHLAKASNLKAIALTDHDTVAGISRAQKEGKLLDIEVIAGIEFSSDYNGKEIHILGLFIDHTNPIINESLEMVINERHRRNHLMLEKLNSLGFEINLSDLSQGGTDEVITRAHFSRALIKKGYVKDNEEAFSKYLGAGCPAYVPKGGFDYKECIKLIHTCGGVAILAHPYIYKFATGNVKGLILDLKSHGLDGVETLYPSHTPEMIHTLKMFCKEQGLLITGGSDFHGGNKPEITLGLVEVPYQLVTTLKTCLTS